MSTTLESLKKPSKLASEAANELVKSHIKSIDEKIKVLPKKLGWNGVTYELPTFFPLEGLDKKSGQTLVYTLILDYIIQKMKLEPKLILEKDKTILVIRFEVTPNSAEIQTMTEYIRNHAIKKSDIDKFIKGEL